jgi:phage/plasmid-associated DNA primase
VFDAIRPCNLVSGVRSVAKTRNVEAFAQSFQSVSVDTKIWNRDHFLLGTPDGTVDLRTGELRPADPKDFITMVTAVAPAQVAASHCGRLRNATLAPCQAVAQSRSTAYEADSWTACRAKQLSRRRP